MELIDINRKLTIEEQKHYLGKLLGFEVDENGAIYDEYGDEFYGDDINDKHDLTTLEGIVKYYAYHKSNWKLDKFKREIKSLYKSNH